MERMERKNQIKAQDSKGSYTMSLNYEQQQALKDLLIHLPAQRPAAPDFLKTWLGISNHELKRKLAEVLSWKDDRERQFLDWVEHRPLDAAFEFLAAAALGFYLSEKDHNPKIKSYVDAFYYISTCASVGYADIFAVTQMGKAIAALVMMVGPALSAKALDRPQTTAAGLGGNDDD
jgi:hypothetical protein